MANHNTGPGLQDGGMTIYYFQPPNNQKTVAFGKVLPSYTFNLSFMLRLVISLFMNSGLPNDCWKPHAPKRRRNPEQLPIDEGGHLQVLPGRQPRFEHPWRQP